MKRGLKLFVWEGVLCDYSCGIMVALAPDVETAREMLRGESYCSLTKERDLAQKSDVYTTPCAFVVWGSD